MFDPLSFGRPAIEPHEQNHGLLGDGLDVLIEAGRDAIEELLASDPASASRFIRAWTSSQAPLLRRLAIHATAKDPSLDPDAKLDWLLREDYLFTPGMKHEAFKLLEVTYASASDNARRRILERVSVGVTSDLTRRLDDETLAYEQYNLLVWLNRIAPDDPLSRDALARIRREHPHFAPRDHPDFESWMSTGFVGPQIDVSSAELLAKDPDDPEAFDWLLRFFAGEGARWPSDAWSRAERISEAVYTNFGWGIRLANKLASTAHFESELWSAVIEGWTKRSLTPSEWEQAVGVIEALRDLCPHAYAISRMLEEGVRREEGSIPEDALPRFARLGLKALNDCPGEEPEEEPQRWLDRAINHPGGKTAEFFLHMISRYWRQREDDWTGIPGDVRSSLERILQRDTFATQLGSCVLASQLHFLYAADREWTVAHVLPMFSWRANVQAAQQAWHGFLVWGRLHSEALVEDLLPYYEETFDHLDDINEYRQQFHLQLAVMAVDTGGTPSPDGWLNRFIATVSPDDRAIWTNQLEHVLANRKEEARVETWRKWLRDYWESRLRGIPLPLAEQEVKEMADLPLVLGSIFDEAVERVVASPPANFGEHYTTYHLAESRFPETNRDAVTKFMVWLLAGTQQPFWQLSYAVRVTDRLEAAGADAESLRTLREHLARLGQI